MLRTCSWIEMVEGCCRGRALWLRLVEAQGPRFARWGAPGPVELVSSSKRTEDSDEVRLD